jgi:Mg-chelatase subunit ChlD
MAIRVERGQASKAIVLETATYMPSVDSDGAYIAVKVSATPQLDSLPVRIVFVADRSGSMCFEDKARLQQCALVEAFEACQRRVDDGGLEVDVALVAFDNSVEVAWPRCAVLGASHAGAASQLQRFKDAVSEIKPRGGTHTANALSSAFAQLEGGGGAGLAGGTLDAVVLLTDGCDSVHQTTPDLIRAIAGKHAHPHVVVHTLGFGEDADAKMLSTLSSRMLGGQYRFVEDVSQISTAVLDTLERVFSRVASAVEVRVYSDRANAGHISYAWRVPGHEYGYTAAGLPDERCKITLAGEVCARDKHVILVPVYVGRDEASFRVTVTFKPYATDSGAATTGVIETTATVLRSSECSVETLENANYFKYLLIANLFKRTVVYCVDDYDINDVGAILSSIQRSNPSVQALCSEIEKTCNELKDRLEKEESTAAYRFAVSSSYVHTHLYRVITTKSTHVQHTGTLLVEAPLHACTIGDDSQARCLSRGSPFGVSPLGAS